MLMTEGRYAFVNDKSNLGPIYRIHRDRWVAKTGNLHSSISCTLTADGRFDDARFDQVALSCRRAGMPGVGPRSPRRSPTRTPEPIGALPQANRRAYHRRHEVTVSNPAKVLFPKPKYTKLDLVDYYLAWRRARCAVRAGGRICWCAFPMASARPRSIRSAPQSPRPPWIEVVTLRFPVGPYRR